MNDYNRGALKEPCLRLMTVDEALQKLWKENDRLDEALEELRYKHSCLIDAVTDGLLSKECTPNEVVVQTMEERWQDKMYELEAENEQLREFVTQLIRFICHEEHQYSCNKECPAYKKCQGSPKCEFVGWAIERADEMRIEVD